MEDVDIDRSGEGNIFQVLYVCVCVRTYVCFIVQSILDAPVYNYFGICRGQWAHEPEK